MPDVLKDLPELQWRGIVLPVATRSVSFQQEDVRHKFEYRDNQFIDSTGTQNRIFRYTIPFRQGLAKGPYRDVFLQLPDFERACRDRSADTLIDPLYGEFRAKVVSYNDDTDIQKRDGTDVTVEFIEAPLIEDDAVSTENFQDLESETARLDEEIEKADWEQEPMPEATNDPLSIIAGVGQQAERQGLKVTAALEDTAFRAEKVDKTIDKVQDPDLWPLKRSARRSRDVAISLQKKASDPLGNIRQVTQRYSAAIAVVANNAGMSLEDFLKLNKKLARQPVVAANTVINVYARG